MFRSFLNIIAVMVLGIFGYTIAVVPNQNIPTPITPKIECVEAIPLPDGYIRVSAAPNSFTHYLRKLLIKQEQSTVYLYNGSPKANQMAHYAILDMDVGERDLQQCADAVMRLRAEYLYSQKRYDDIHFNFLSDGKPRYFNDYAPDDKSYPKFRSYMDYIFSYANTRSLFNELPSVPITDIKPGDTFINTGNPYGHAVMVMDVAVHQQSGKRIFLLAQSYMPAQDIHILKNNNNRELSPWYSSSIESILYTPEYTFDPPTLKRFDK